MSSMFSASIGVYVFVSCLLRVRSKFFHKIVNCLPAGNSFIIKFTSKSSPILSYKSIFHIGVIQQYTLL
jgi:hypothetical protein